MINATPTAIGEHGRKWITAIAAFAAAAFIFQCPGAATARTDEWPPHDPEQETTAIPFTANWAAKLRDVRTFVQLQDAAGAKGKIIESLVGAETPSVAFHWSSVAPDGRRAQMRARLFSTGDFSATISPIEDGETIVLNNFGAFVCTQCSPPVSACGRRPSWIPHDLHWDNFDCRCTLTGPQSVRDGHC